MIESLDISHLGVIESAHVDFGEGLIVVTGETGAGKTMVLSSLQLLLGIFSVGEEIAARVEESGGLVEGGELIVGRSVRAAGRSRAHLGSRPVPASVLTDIVGSMVTIHGQADQIRLTGEAAQRRALDQFGGEEHAAALEEYRAAFRHAVDVKHRLDSLRGDASERAEELEDLRAAIQQIEELDPVSGEEEDLVREAARLTNVEDLRALTLPGQSRQPATPTRSSMTQPDSTRSWLSLWDARVVRCSSWKRLPMTSQRTCRASMRIRRGWRRFTRGGRPSRTFCAGGLLTSRSFSRGSTRLAAASKNSLRRGPILRRSNVNWWPHRSVCSSVGAA